jgi:hypothetical protein
LPQTLLIKTPEVASFGTRWICADWIAIGWNGGTT